ncbi:hypothetical protein PENTCL1PPCAC_16994, partial [Pristionchus entomophagus]
FFSSKTRYMHGSTHPTVSQSSIAGRLLEEPTLFLGESYSGTGENTRIIKSPNWSFRVNGILYYWDPVFVPPDCGSASKADSSRQKFAVVPSSTSEGTSTRNSSTTSTTTSASTSKPSSTPPSKVPIVFISSRVSTTTQSSSTSTSKKTFPTFTSTTKITSSTSSSTTKSTTIPSSSSSTSTSLPSTTDRPSTSDVDFILDSLQSLHTNDNNYTIGEEVPRARRQVVAVTHSRNSVSSTTNTLPSPIRPNVNISQIDPCVSVDGSPEVCTRLLDRRDSRDPFMHMTFPNGTKVMELAWRCPGDLHCCEWECCEMRPPRHRQSALPFVITACFLVLAVILCIFCSHYCKETEQRRRAVESLGENTYQMSVVTPPQAVDSEDFDESPRAPPPVPRMHFHGHEEHRPHFVPPPIPPADRVNGTYR